MSSVQIMGAYGYIQKSFREEYKARSAELRDRIIAWRKEPSVERVARPTNITRARELGYKAKQGVIVVRVRIRRGLRKRVKPMGGRKPSRSGRFFAYRPSSQSVAEGRAARKFSNCEVLNSYYVGADGDYKFFEVILLDRSNPSITGDRHYSTVVDQKGRVFRGLTSSGRRHRGIIKRGFGTSGNRPSVRSNIRA